MEIIIASRNLGKIREIKEELSSTGALFRTYEDFSDWEEVDEDAETLLENAVKKARALCDKYGLPAISDDTGLFVDALCGAPGVECARFAGPEQNPDKNIELLLEKLKGVPLKKRKAKFVCVLVLALPGGDMKVARGECEGYILSERKGSGGFGYDPVFRPEGFEKTFAELTTEEKNKISHRGKALKEMKRIIAEICGSSR